MRGGPSGGPAKRRFDEEPIASGKVLCAKGGPRRYIRGWSTDDLGIAGVPAAFVSAKQVLSA